MPSVFTDETANNYDLAILNAADWAVLGGELPNGDNALDGDGSIAATSNVNGDDFNFADGTAWTIEFWLKRTAAFAGPQVVMMLADPATTTEYWRAYLDSDDRVKVHIINTAASQYLDCQSAVIAIDTWYHFVGVKETGGVLKLYRDATLETTDNTTLGTARTPTASSRLYLGTRGNGAWSLSTTYISKVAIYNFELSSTRITAHYLAMTT